MNNFKRGDAVRCYGDYHTVSRTDGPYVYFTSGGYEHYLDVVLDTASDGQTLGDILNTAVKNREITREIEAGRVLEAIRLYRTKYGVGLKEAKDAVEAMRDELRNKFKVGDCVMCTLDGDIGTVTYVDEKVYARWNKHPTTCGIDPKHILHVSSAASPSIVARKVGHGYQFSNNPMVHPTETAATKEAERLALANPGVEFGTFVLAHKSRADVPAVRTMKA